MTTLRVVVDQMAAPVPGGIGRYTEELTQALIAAAPANCAVEGIVSSSSEADYASIEERLPGLASLYKTTLARRELSAAWQLGLSTSPGPGMIHAPGLLAPLRRHDRVNSGTQVAVTVHDTLVWSHPEAFTATTVAWTKGMIRRAKKHADAIVVPSHAVAAQLSEIVDLGDRVRVIGPALSRTFQLPGAGLAGEFAAQLIDERLGALNLPSEYILTAGTLEPRKGVAAVIAALGEPGAPDLPLVVLGPDSWGELNLATVADEAGLKPGRVQAFPTLSNEDLALVMSRASAFVYPSLDEGFGLPMIQAFQMGTPVIHSDAPALVETSGDAGFVVERNDADGYPRRLAAALTTVLGDRELADRLRVYGSDRSRAFSWRDSAERVWQLHADL
ncbi:glycosyltransferase family 4 protein [Glaciibacter psychrotolerans]|uniref:Glycosyltransferase involved in cell wall biosynthesis n=1 Tax=Glaciibacter psychrotolerans TaxID=670054 RepID=A0A7Z0EEY3_9MICO|nr:glycosyltransferase family 1 protein [Leifsonia psychrotolerans]NYJ20266.1 glycosyltransferase involved in cell wall biosynthesis [Leifsonia psychrotolerans]